MEEDQLPHPTLDNYLSSFQQLRYIWKDAIPDRVVHSSDPDNQYKVRKGWFVAILSDAEEFAKQFNVGPALDKTQSFRSWYTLNVSRVMTTPQHISQGNQFLDYLIQQVESVRTS